MNQIKYAPLLGLLLSMLAGNSFAQGEGTAVGVNPDAVARIDATDRLLQVGADISVGELVVTGNSGLVQIIFDDDTRLAVGPRSSLLIETYLMASTNTAEKLTINALGGSFRFITGNSPKPAYTINTPTASIAVRGTEFDLVVERSNTKVMLYDGALRLCNATGDCQELADRCGVGTASSQSAKIYRRNDPLREPLSVEFRYARFQGTLLPGFQVNGATRCAETRAEAYGGSTSSGTVVNGTPAQQVPAPTQTPTPQLPGRN